MADLAERKLTSSLRQTYRLAALALAMGMGLDEAAAHARIEPERLAAYQRDPRFQAFLEEFNQEIEKTVIERVVRRQVKALATMQVHAVDAAERVVNLMQSATNESVSLQAAKGILRQTGIDLDSVRLGDGDIIDPEKELQKTDPGFLERHEEALKEIEAGDE